MGDDWDVDSKPPPPPAGRGRGSGGVTSGLTQRVGAMQLSSSNDDWGTPTPAPTASSGWDAAPAVKPAAASNDDWGTPASAAKPVAASNDDWGAPAAPAAKQADSNGWGSSSASSSKPAETGGWGSGGGGGARTGGGGGSRGCHKVNLSLETLIKLIIGHLSVLIFSVVMKDTCRENVPKILVGEEVVVGVVSR